MGRKRVTTTNENSTGRNTAFHDNYTNNDMTRAQFVKQIESGNYDNYLIQFVKQIESGNYDNYHVRNINGVKTPVSNPDKNVNNNLD